MKIWKTPGNKLYIHNVCVCVCIKEIMRNEGWTQSYHSFLRCWITWLNLSAQWSFCYSLIFFFVIYDEESSLQDQAKEIWKYWWNDSWRETPVKDLFYFTFLKTSDTVCYISILINKGFCYKLTIVTIFSCSINLYCSKISIF